MKSKILNATIAAIALASTTVTLVGCSSATPTDTPGVDRMGQYILRQFGPELWTVLGYRFANSQIGDEWLILEVALSAPDGQTARVRREDVSIRTPDGKQLSLPSQKEFGEAWGALRPVISQANINRDPLEYFPQNRRECSIQFFVAPGEGVAFDEVSLNHLRGCFGRFFVYVPGGIQQGRWVLGIDQPESEIRIPFELGE